VRFFRGFPRRRKKKRAVGVNEKVPGERRVTEYTNIVKKFTAAYGGKRGESWVAYSKAEGTKGHVSGRTNSMYRSALQRVFMETGSWTCVGKESHERMCGGGGKGAGSRGKRQARPKNAQVEGQRLPTSAFEKGRTLRVARTVLKKKLCQTKKIK